MLGSRARKCTNEYLLLDFNAFSFNILCGKITVLSLHFSVVDQIYHLASPASPPNYMYNPIKTLKTNTIGTLNMLGKLNFFYYVAWLDIIESWQSCWEGGRMKQMSCTFKKVVSLGKVRWVIFTLFEDFCPFPLNISPNEHSQHGCQSIRTLCLSVGYKVCSNYRSNRNN